MKLTQLTTLLPCQSLEDLTLDRAEDEAEQILGAWSTLWHPALLAAARCLPIWSRAECPPEEPADALIIVPECCESLVPEDWFDKAESAGALVLRHLPNRPAMIAAALERLAEDPAHDLGKLPDDLAANFLAMGFCHFQVELLTRQLRYMSNLDESQMQIVALDAADAALAGNKEAAYEHLRSGFDLLTEAREYFYPVEASLLDLTLLAPTTLGPALARQLTAAGTSNLLLSGDLAERMATSQPETAAALRGALERGEAAIIGGEFDESELPLLPPEAMRRQLLKGAQVYRDLFGLQPGIFGRRRFGLTPVLPQILAQLGFDGAFHVTLDDGRFPVGNQSKIRWKGVDGTVVEGLSRLPQDASKAATFLAMPEKLGEALDLDHTASLIFAHWPGCESPWYDDLRRVAAYVPVLGKFVPIDKYFDDTRLAGQTTQHKADQYRSPYLAQAVSAERRDPISCWVRYFGRQAAIEALQTTATLVRIVGPVQDAPSGENRLSDSDEIAQLADQATAARAAETAPDGEIDEELDRRLATRLATTLDQLADALPGGASPEQKGYVSINPCGFPRRVCLPSGELESLPAVEGPIRAVGPTEVIVDTPAMGFSWVGPGEQSCYAPRDDDPAHLDTAKKKNARLWGWGKKPKEDPPLAEENVLRNEFFEVRFDPHTGAIRSLDDYRTRGNRLAQQIAFRMPPPSRSDDRAADPEHRYSIMAADEITVTSTGPVRGEMVARGRLVDRQCRRLAGFQQTTRLWRGRRILEIEIELDVDQLPGANPWDSYYGVRWAWADATVDLFRDVNGITRPTDIDWFEAGRFVDVRSGKQRTTILTAGLPFHRRFGLRKLDSLLVVRGETARSFRLGIGIDLQHPMPSAVEMLTPPTHVVRSTGPPQGGTGWLFHIDSKNVMATSWEPIVAPGGEGRGTEVRGFRVGLLETEGRRVRVGLRAMKTIGLARKRNLGGQPIDEELMIAGDRVTLELGAHEWTFLEAEFEG
ncbi:MAG: hypothetical protein HQ581_22010 [Planctomycetes bacterium]|nr:hypothetical protein [Planctomycetota bacterium]